MHDTDTFGIARHRTRYRSLFVTWVRDDSALRDDAHTLPRGTGMIFQSSNEFNLKSSVELIWNYFTFYFFFCGKVRRGIFALVVKRVDVQGGVQGGVEKREIDVN